MPFWTVPYFYSFPPICALWVVMVPLCDCVSLMARRRKAGKSALVADREHIHYYLRNRGLSVAATQWTIALANAVCALFAVVSLQHGVPEPAFFGMFVALSVAYHVFSEFIRGLSTNDSTLV